MKCLQITAALSVMIALWFGGVEYGRRKANRDTLFRFHMEVIRTSEAHETNNYYALEIWQMADRFAVPRLASDGGEWLKWLKRNDP